MQPVNNRKEGEPLPDPDLMDEEQADSLAAPQSPTSWLIGTDLVQARKRIRWGGGAGLAAAAINFIVIMSTYFVGDTGVEGVIQPSGGQFLFVLVEAVLLTGLAVGVLRRNRTGAMALLAYHVVSKLALFGLAAFGLGPGNLNPVSMVLNLVFAYLFFQGLRGIFTWNYLTHPQYPVSAPESQLDEEYEETPREDSRP